MGWSVHMERVVLALCIGAFCLALGLRSQLNLWVATGAAAAFCALVVALFRNRVTGASLGRPQLRSFLIGAGVGVVMAVATWGLYPLAEWLFPAVRGEVETLYALLREPPGPIRAFPLLLFVVATEEVVWRGLAIDTISRSSGARNAVVLSAVLYVLPQVAMRSPVLMVVALLCGLVWGLLRVRYAGLTAPLSAHAVWDLLVFVLYPIA